MIYLNCVHETEIAKKKYYCNYFGSSISVIDFNNFFPRQLDRWRCEKKERQA